MNDAALYAKSSINLTVAVREIFKEFWHLFQWRENGQDTILDIGCGTGEATIESIVPLLPANFNLLVGCDICDDMIDYARKHSGHSNVIYHKLDIGGDVDEFQTKFGSFDHVVSFFCLHWIPDQYAAMNNISKLLTTDGDCLSVVISWSPLFTVYRELLKTSKWAQYMQGAEQFISPYQDCACPEDHIRKTLQAVGYTSYYVQARELKHVYKNYDHFVDFITSVNAFVSRIPVSELHEFAVDVATRVMVKNKERHGMELKFSTGVLIVFAKK